MADDKNWASIYLLDPLNAPQPGEETGPGSSFTKREPPSTSPSFPRRSASAAHRPRQSSGSNNPYHNYPTPPASASPRSDRFPSMNPNNSLPSPQRRFFEASQPLAPDDYANRPRRTASLSARYPGDRSHRPLDIIKRDTKLANRAPHLRKTHIPGTDTIDSLDNIGPSSYHHEGPYDATLLSRNLSLATSPVAAVRATNAEALRATPREVVRDSVVRHRPLDRVAAIPPGRRDLSGRKMVYEEGTDMMIANGGDYKRWPGITYLPEDHKGKGEPAFSIERALSQKHGKKNDDDDDDDVWPGGRQRAVSATQGGGRAFQGAYEMQPQKARPASSEIGRSPGGATASGSSALGSHGITAPVKDGKSHGRNISAGSIGAGIKRGLGSLRRRKERA